MMPAVKLKGMTDEMAVGHYNDVALNCLLVSGCWPMARSMLMRMMEMVTFKIMVAMMIIVMMTLMMMMVQ